MATVLKTIDYRQERYIDVVLRHVQTFNKTLQKKKIEFLCTKSVAAESKILYFTYISRLLCVFSCAMRMQNRTNYIQTSETNANKDTTGHIFTTIDEN